ncbi:GEVED domain-containing protein [Flavobacterium sp.]|uniref:GEVED domain-containing protein n=1 Tax=Flavobacterium sp. TaxID=239 RepID=UPI003752787A
MKKKYAFGLLSVFLLKTKKTNNKKLLKTNSWIALITLLIVPLLSTSLLNAQTTIINPATVGGFESGTTFASNGWTNTSGTATRNQWICNTGATVGFSGTRCAYVSQNSGGTPPPHTYDVTAARATHVYRDITIPAGESNIALSFTWIGQGETSFDRLRVWVVPTTVTPAYGTGITTSGTAPTGNIQIGGDLNSQGTWTTANLTLPTAYAGTTVRLVFEWTNDGSGGTQPPGAIDNISLVSSAPSAPCAYTASNGSYWISNVTTTGGFSNINNTTTFTSGGYGDYYASQVVSQIAGGAINFAVNMSSGTHGINIYVDWNNDFDFADAGEKVYASAGYVASAASSFNIPGAQAIGNYRMRVVSHYLNTNPPACSSETYTEAEDYRIQVTTPPTCYPPTGLAANASSTTSGDASWIAPTIGTAPAGYQYVISTSNTLPGGAGTPVAVTTASFTGLTPNTTYYIFVRSDCGAGDFSSWIGTSLFTGYCSSTSTGSSYFVNNFSTSGGTSNITNNGSGLSAGGYGNFTAQVVSQVASSSVSFSTAITGGTAGINIWVDWNNDLDFNDAGEKVYASGAYVSTATGTIGVPATAAVGNYRMRIVANGSSTNPAACGSTTSSETEDYTFTVLAPLPCAGNPTAISVFIASSTSTTVSWTAGVPAPSSGYEYILSTTNTFPAPAAVPTGSVGAGITSVTLTGLTLGTTYYFWVRANCTASGTGNGVWVGTTTFTQPTCSVGPGTGTTTLGCPNTISGGLGLSGAPAPPINCSTGACANLEATFSPIKQTTSYTVASIPYAPPYQFNCMRNPVSVNIDDKWSPIINLPFNFCFYGNTYNKCLIGSNGVITFDTVVNTPGGTCNWSFNTDSGTASNIPVAGHSALIENSIFGVFHDINPLIGGEVGWELITLNTGCRALVASWSNVPMYSSDTTNDYTGMMVLYENTNIIEVYIQKKRITTHTNSSGGIWNGGNAIVGLQNATGTLATVAPGRNGLDPDWTATNEAWRFTPNGANVPTSIKWYEGGGTTGTVVGNAATVSVCPAATTVYTAELTYTLCNGLVYSNTAQTTVTVNTDKTWNGSADTNWNTASNWTPSGVPTAAQSVSIANVTNDPIIGTGANALACSVTVQNGGVLTINAGYSITVTNAVTVISGGAFNIKNTGSLVQTNNVMNSGNINMERIANLRLQDYCYWSSPVGNLLAGTFPVQSVSPLTPAGYIFKWGTTTANPNGGQGNWVNTTENMIPGTGYILRAPNGFTNAAPSALTANFIGVPNNGTFSPSIFRGTNYTTVGTQGIPRTATDDNWNLIGNPYPSAIGVNEFLTLPANSNIVGSVKIWSHGLLPTNVTDPFYQNFAVSYFPSDYITINLTGATSGALDYKIGSGQGFMVLMNAGAAGSNTVTFNNSMRSPDFANNQFYKNANTTNTLEKNRIWLDLVSSTGEVNRTLVGYVEGATKDEDRLYDMFTDNKPSQNFYSLINENPMIIQGKALPFDINDTIPMGVQIPASGTFNIAIAEVDGLFKGGAQIVYLEDKLLNVIHNLTAAPYQFLADQGITNDRFVIRYTKKAFSNNDFNSSNNIKVFTNGGINIISTKENIKDIIIYDVLGKTLLDKKNVSKHEVILTELRPTTNVLVVKVILANDTVVIKKVIY